jgi:hypothetical protein
MTFQNPYFPAVFSMDPQSLLALDFTGKHTVENTFSSTDMLENNGA